MSQGTRRSRLRRFVRNHIVPNVDRIINLASLTIGTLSFVLALVVWRLPEPLPLYIFLRDLAIFTTIWLVNMFLIFRYARRVRNLDRARTYMTKYHHNTQNMVAGYKDEIFDFFLSTVQIKSLPKIDDQEFNLFEKVCFILTTETRNALKDYFQSRGIEIGEDVAVTVKLIVDSASLANSPDVKDEDKQKLQTRLHWVKTAYRDPYTHANYKRVRRVADDRLYDIPRNTAFENILQQKKPFLSNNLQIMEPAYQNENPHWRDQYNATLVVPIQYENEVTKNSLCFGFLAADSLNRDGEELYDTEGCLNILNHSADLLAIFFLSLFLYNHQPSNSTASAQIPHQVSTAPSN